MIWQAEETQDTVLMIFRPQNRALTADARSLVTPMRRDALRKNALKLIPREEPLPPHALRKGTEPPLPS